MALVPALRRGWVRVPARVRSLLGSTLKLLLTIGAFYLLLTHQVRTDDGRHVTALRAIADYLPQIDASIFWRFVALAAAIKFVGILASMYRWYLLLEGQGIRFPFGHIFGTFLIGRFLGTFLPSTVGLDGYKLYDAARYSGRTAAATAATAIEKVLGIVGMFLTFLIALPFGYEILGPHAPLVAAGTVPIALGVITLFFVLAFRPTLVQGLLRRLPLPGRGRVQDFLTRASDAAAVYRDQKLLLMNAAAQSFLVHFCTAAMYFFTALAIGAAGARFWEVTFASTIQIFATVMSPFTIAGEGVREIVQTLLLAKKIGTTESIMSAALGFWAAEALTLGGGWFWWRRGPSYRPAYVVIDGERQHGIDRAPRLRRAAID
jgi:glycosyltransferase 2 family protein